MKTLNIGLIGAGFMGKAHSLAYAAMPMFFWPAPAIPVRKMIAEATDDLARGSGTALRLRVSSLATGPRLVEDPSIDIVEHRDAQPPARRDRHSRRGGRQAYPLREAARPYRGRGEEMLDAVEAAGVIAHGRLQLPPHPGRRRSPRP